MRIGAGCQESDGRREGSRRPRLPYPRPQRYIFRRKTAPRNVSLQVCFYRRRFNDLAGMKEAEQTLRRGTARAERSEKAEYR
jgi:hypothetical protein